MTEQQFREEAVENVRQIVNCIADHEYEKLRTVTAIDLSVHSSYKSQFEAIEEITAWLEEQLQIWSEYENKEFVVDHFDEKYFYFNIHQFESNSAFGYFRPHSHGEELDVTFEFDFAVDDERVVSLFSINV